MNKEQLKKQLKNFRVWDENLISYTLTDFSVNNICEKIIDNFKLNKIKRISLKNLEVENLTHHKSLFTLEECSSTLLNFQLWMDDYEIHNVTMELVVLLIK